MLAVLFNSVLVAALLVVAGVFIRGAFKHTVTNVLGETVVETPGARRLGYMRVAGKMIWHVAGAAVLFMIQIFYFFLSAMAAEESSEKKETVWHDGAEWEKDQSGDWDRVSGDENASHPYW